MDLEMHQTDVRMTFLDDELDVEIYMEQPEGLNKMAESISYAC